MGIQFNPEPRESGCLYQGDGRSHGASGMDLGDILKLNSKDWVTDWEYGVRETQGLRAALLIF